MKISKQVEHLVPLSMKGAWMKCYSPEFNEKALFMGESARSYDFIKGEPQRHWRARDSFPQGLADLDIASPCGRSARRYCQQYEYERAALQAAKYMKELALPAANPDG
ncbi:hypothetical protein TMEN_7359 [Trichophyton mentagrophytes]|uniref:Uncharacterized protein n=1 Tax=Trichophyton interdigitale (strain MR816) TaxID=1215338 RepID=A0A059JGE8_TRIIM|nr:hypothetical protein H101_00946 [Trichophyton interdigitale H6]KDB26718.1 hypothetical protein H109_01526 [Trichophyton interdigitale MR816]GBF64643.1 hypothetical protein TMEN_7359 [Trichophyton mentagrophytes]